MARIRYLKPEYFTDEDIAELKPIERLFYQGLWCHADKSGRLEDRPGQLKTLILPYDRVDADKILDRLTLPKTNGRLPFIVRYTGKDGRKYIQIVQWEKHQKPHSTERDSDIPAPDNSYLTVKKPLDNVDTASSPLKIMGKGSVVKGNGEGKVKEEQAQPAAPSPSEALNAVVVAKERVLAPNQLLVECFKKAYLKMTGYEYHDKKQSYIIAQNLINKFKYDQCLEKCRILFLMCKKRSAFFTKEGFSSFTVEALSTHWDRILPDAVSKEASELDAMMEYMQGGKDDAINANG